ncbi:MAG: DHH family phosphoesterase [Patescibacteria group bacterium]
MKLASDSSIKKFFDENNKIVVIQADNPDGDSLASALAIGKISESLGKDVYQYCAVNIASYLDYIKGYDTITSELPLDFDATIIVDASAKVLFEALEKSGKLAQIGTKPCLVIDHHSNECDLEFATVVYQKKAVSASQLVDEVAKIIGADMEVDTKELITIGILSDSLGLVSEATDSKAVRLIADYIDDGVSLAKIDNLRRETYRKSPEIIRYKAQLLSRIEYWADGQVSTVTIPWKEIEQYSHEYNPSMLVIEEMRQATGVNLAVAFKIYPDRITAKLRANYGHKICDKIAEKFGGGGHPYASGFKIKGKNLNVDDITNKVIIEYLRLIKDD